MSKYYKVLSKLRSNRLVSAVKGRKVAIVEYNINKPTKPTFGCLFVFKKLKSARDFMLYASDNCELWEVKIKNPKQIERIANDTSVTVDILKQFWENPEDFPYQKTMTVPEDTIICDEVTLFRKVFPEEIKT